MRSIPLALTWELLQHRRWQLLGALLGANLLPVLLFTGLRRDGPLDADENTFLVIHMVMTQINMLVFGTAVFAAQDRPARLYAFPIPTTTLVTWQLLPPWS